MSEFNASIILLLGKERFLKEEIISNIKKRWIKDDFAITFNYNVFYGEESSLSDIIDTANTLPMMSEKRIITVFNFDENPDAKDLFSFYPSLCPTTILILVSSEEDFWKVLDKKFQNRFMEQYGKNAIIKNFYDMNYTEIVRWVKETALENNLNLTPDAAERLVEISGTDLSVLYQEIKKLNLLEKDKKVYDIEDIEKIVSRDLEVSVEEICDFVMKKDLKAVCRTFRKFAQRFNRSEYILLLNELSRFFYIVAKAHELAKLEGLNIQELSKRPELKIRYPALRERFFNAMKNFSEKEVEKNILLFYPMDKILKSKSEEEIQMYFERFLIALSGKRIKR